MPIYEYYCPYCKNKFELMRSMRAATEKADCPSCGKPADRALSRFACLAKDTNGYTTPVSGGSSCSSCSSSSCSTCGG